MIVAAVIMVISAVYAGVQSKKAAQAARDAAKGVLYQTRSTQTPRRIIYGRTRVGGIEVNVASSGSKNEYLHYILVWGDGPYAGCDDFLFDGVVVTVTKDGHQWSGSGTYAGLVYIEHADGLVGQESIGEGSFPNWTTADRLVGIAHSYVRLKYNQKVWNNGVPNMSAIWRGRTDIYDPRIGATAYTTNVALCANHFMTLSRMGLGCVYSTEIDETTLITAADDCEDTIALSAGGSESRYTFNGAVSLDLTGEDILELFKTAMAGNILYVQGRWKFYAGVYREPSITIDQSVFAGGVSMRTKSPRNNRINTVRGLYASESTGYWQPISYPAFYENSFIEADDDEEMSAELDLLYTSSSTMCRRIAKIKLYQARYERTVKVRCNIEAWQAQVGLPVYFDFPSLGFNNTEMDVIRLDLVIEGRKIFVDLELKETNAAIYAWNSSEDSGGTDPSVTIPGTTNPDNDFGLDPDLIAGGLTYGELP